jgi:hypothetical protein
MKKVFRHESAPRRIAGEVDDELAFHIQERTEKLIGQGMSPTPRGPKHSGSSATCATSATPA